MTQMGIYPSVEITRTRQFRFIPISAMCEKALFIYLLIIVQID